MEGYSNNTGNSSNRNENHNQLIVYNQGNQHSGLDFAFALLGVGMILILAILVAVVGLIALPFAALAFLIAILAGK